VTIDGATIGGTVKTQDATATNPLIVRDSNITGSINIGKATNIEITGNMFTGGSITDETGNSTPCLIAGNTGASSVVFCPLT